MSVKATLDAHGLAPQKKWGQNFLTDPRILESIADAAELTPDDTVLEIGPGLGHLTRVLARRAGRVVAVELDRGLALQLSSDLSTVPNVRIIQADILQQEPIAFIGAGDQPASPSTRFKIVANLPYYITSAVLRHVLVSPHKPRLAVVMVQRQVAQRLAAHPPEMSLLAVSVQFYADVSVRRTVPAGAFYPRPKVDSAVVRLDVLDHSRLPEAETDAFFTLLRAGFGERRKQLRNALAHGLSLGPERIAVTLARARIDPSRRAETLSLEEWGALHRELQSATIGARR
ncbi:MAG: 16S rRNA (adenine(1518)-N(6)/adenine(1519)-N(6))-dimethyltransferase RsmA [Chloroflexi bacterium]|nr:16S rRNA (adenine(1518)-N(6)/adenine(1519)-N(6))-dimethyltransferase RsmA [Chloroflexota bacterium]